MACEFCRQLDGHDFRCPNYVPPNNGYHCSVCKEPILNGEEYIKNDDSDYAHWDCVCYGRELVKFLGYKIKRMEDEDDLQNENLVRETDS